uniref:Transcription factor E2F7 n=1 Tax=Cyclopterus lumpus TaxID=8103 RepID=A0A8C3B3G7_CYCLU
MAVFLVFGLHFSQMEVECLALKDLTSPRKGFTEEDGGQSEQKENICVERRRCTPLKSAESPIPALLLNRKGATPDLAHVTPIKHTALAEPWTPTANLKMLISAASPDIRDREMKKVLFRPIENERDKPESPDTVAEDTEVEDSCQFEAVDEEDDADKKPSRKQKSLGLLCQKFLALYPDYPPLHSPIWISLDEVATSLGVERRRIYDIVNVLESLMIVGRIAKNSYTWYGRLRLEATLEELQRRGRQQGYHLQMDLATKTGGNRKDKSLRIMSQKFVMLFLVSKTQTVTLDAAAKILIEESQDSSSHSKYKTKVRRLYDIANVLTSLGLIKKVHVREERGRKPAFKWLGPVDFKSSGSAGENQIGYPCVMICLFPPPTTGLPTQPVDYSKKTTINSAVCRLQFGNGTDNRPAGSPLAPSSTRPAPQAPPLHPEHHFATSSPPHCLAYLPSLSQPSVVMLYRAPEGPRSPGAESDEGRKRRREERDEEGTPLKCMSVRMTRQLIKTPGLISISTSLYRSGGYFLTRPSHLQFSSSPGLNSLNFLLSAGQPPAGLALPHSGVPTLALPYVLVPSATLSHYPLVAGALQQQGPEARSKLSFSLPAHFMVGAAPYGLAAASEYGGSPALLPSTPEQSRLYGLAAGTPHTPKEAALSASKAFFQTPGTLGSGVSAAPAARKRGSAQRRLDVGHPHTNRLDM